MYGGHVDDYTRAMLVALGDGGTVELAERAVAFARRHRPPLVLGGLHEVCLELGESRQTVGHWLAGRRTPPVPFPEPGWRVKVTPLWDMDELRRTVKTSEEGR